MHVLMRIYDIISLSSLMMVMVWMIYGAGGGLMEKKWEKMKWMMDKHHKDHHYHHDYEKSIGINVKPIAIPIPLPLPVPVLKKYESHPPPYHPPPPKPWKAESKDMLWKMMMMKMITKGDKGCCPKKVMMPVMMKADKGKKGKDKGCPMMSGWPMMKAMMKAAPMMCAPAPSCDMAMDKGWPAPMMSGWPAPMMKGWPAPMMMKGWPAPMMTGWPAPMMSGWPAPMKGGGMMCCPSMGGWPDEEEEEDEEEEYPDEYDEPMSGWDTVNEPTYLYPRTDFANSKKGDASDIVYLGGKGVRTFLRKGL